jgi:hypothetical protein
MPAMKESSLRSLLKAVRAGKTDVDQALRSLRHLPYEDLGFARVDHHRSLRCGFPEVIFCPGKTTQQVVTIFGRLAQGGGNVLASRATLDTYQSVRNEFPAARYNELGRTITLRQVECRRPHGHIALVAAGTSDLSVAEEARATAEIMDQRVTTHYDVGVAGLHRLLGSVKQLQRAHVLIVVAGYGASFGGLAALLTMLNSCAAGVSVVNIDNGFAAGYIAAMINRQVGRKKD